MADQFKNYGEMFRHGIGMENKFKWGKSSGRANLIPPNSVSPPATAYPYQSMTFQQGQSAPYDGATGFGTDWGQPSYGVAGKPFIPASPKASVTPSAPTPYKVPSVPAVPSFQQAAPSMGTTRTLPDPYAGMTMYGGDRPRDLGDPLDALGSMPTYTNPSVPGGDDWMGRQAMDYLSLQDSLPSAPPKSTSFMDSDFMKGMLGPNGWGGMALGTANSLLSGYFGMKNYGLQKDAYNFNKASYLDERAANMQMTNLELGNKAAALASSSSKSFTDADREAYIKKNGIQPWKG